MDFSKFWIVSCMPPSRVTQQYNSLMELYTNFPKFHFSWKYIFPLLLYLCMLELIIWLCIHLWFNWFIINIQGKWTHFVKIYVQRQWRVLLFCMWYHRFWQNYRQESATYNMYKYIGFKHPLITQSTLLFGETPSNLSNTRYKLNPRKRAGDEFAFPNCIAMVEVHGGGGGGGTSVL